MADTEDVNQTVSEKRGLIERLDAMDGGMFLVWRGVAFAANVGWDVGILGVGSVVVVSALLRKPRTQ